MSNDNINLRGPFSIWCTEAGPAREELDDIRPGGHVQSGVKIKHGVDSVWIRVHAVHRNTLKGIIIDGSGRGSPVRFHRRDVWRVL